MLILFARLFSTPTGATATPSSGRKRRALPSSEVVNAIIKSSPVPVSSADATESLEILADLCPFFLNPLKISGEDWLEMQATQQQPDLGSPGGDKVRSPGGPKDAATDIATRSPRRVKKEGGGIREVREIIRREIESRDF
jgi:hypothetical protein